MAETLNAAAKEKLPILFVVIDNGRAINTFTGDVAKNQDVFLQGQHYGVPGVKIDGQDLVGTLQVPPLPSILSPCQHVSMSACQHVSTSACQHVILSACQRVSMSACHRVMSACHPKLSHDHRRGAQSRTTFAPRARPSSRCTSL